MSDETKKVKKKRMTDVQWAEARAMWASGEFTLEQIAERFGVAPETLSRRFKKDGVKKGQSQVAKQVEAEIAEKAVQQVDKWAERAEQAREKFFNTNEILHNLLRKTVAAAARDEKLFAAQPDLKAIQMAAKALGDLRANQWTVIGLDKEGAEDDEIPELLVTTLTSQQIEELQNRQLGGFDDEIEVGNADPYLEDAEGEDDDLVIEEADD